MLAKADSRSGYRSDTSEVQRSRNLRKQATEQIARAKSLCEISHDILQANADFRDFLRESRLISMSRRERRINESE